PVTGSVQSTFSRLRATSELLHASPRLTNVGKSMTRSLFSIGSILVTLGSAGLSRCDTNQQGNLAAHTFGDLTHALATRSPASDPIAKACGLVARPRQGSAELRRRPYLQRMTDRALDVVWAQS